jgi:hypothetical protein
MATSSLWHEGAASIVLLPGGEEGERILNIVEEWTKCWMLKPAFWVHSSDEKISNDSVPRITTCVIGRNGRRDIELLDYLSTQDFEQVRLIAIRTVDQTGEHDTLQDKIVDQVKDALERARPYEIATDRADKPTTKFVRINLIFAPTSRKGASATHLLEPSWDINLVVAPEDRSTPSRFDRATRDVTESDQAVWLRFILANAAVTGGIWAGQEKGILEASHGFQDLSPVQGQVRVMRSFVRGILSEGLSTRVAADALDRASKADQSKIDPLRGFPNPHLEAIEADKIAQQIEKMVNDTFTLSKDRLVYKRVTLLPLPAQQETGVGAAIKHFFRGSWSLLKVLPLWIFTGIWNAIAGFVSRLIFGLRGRKVVKGSIDFPRTDLDKGAEIDITSISERRAKILEILAAWPNNVLRKSEPILWGDIRKLVLGRLDGSPLPTTIEKMVGTSGTQVFGDMSDVIPDMNEKWALPAHFERTLPSQARSTGWRDTEVVEDLAQYLGAELARVNARIEELRLTVTTSDTQKTEKEAELLALIQQLEAMGSTKIGAHHE